jgi:hypothetical protein
MRKLRFCYKMKIQTDISSILLLATVHKRCGDRDAAYVATWQAWNGYMEIYGEHGTRAPEIDALVKRRKPTF